MTVACEQGCKQKQGREERIASQRERETETEREKERDVSQLHRREEKAVKMDGL